MRVARLPWPGPLAPGAYRAGVRWIHGEREVARDDLVVTVEPALALHPSGVDVP
ncbi:MAG: hypothetical protein IMX02_08840 [Limnochordaceae bacterium]|nr:hypothetical protein [Limnochordaceae bacterium]